ncbi:MAG: hypothetical protein HYU84_06900 [Chloroflexi bacterium]|nr:hypothetical protein [Chloroflexota bacterium]MBI3170473.1 hypothetical protein [Chloroflexota bacterium]
MNESTPIIRPMTLGEILDKAIRLYRQNFLKFIGIFAIPYIPLVLIQTVVSVLYTSAMLQPNFLEQADPTAAMGIGIATIIGSLIYLVANFILVSGFATAALTRAVANNYMDKPIGILDSYRAISGSVWKLVAALFLAALLLFVLIFWAMMPLVGWFSGPGIIMFLSLIVIPMIAPVASLEKLGVRETLRRAWDLGRSRFWWLIGYSIVLALLGQLIVTGPVYLLSAILQGAFAALAEISFEMQSVLNTLLTSLLSLALGLLYSPLQLTMMTVVYFDLRARSEGLDLALQLAPPDETQIELAALPEISTKASTPLLTGIDIGRFALLSLVGVMLFGCYFFFMFMVLGLASLGL